MPSKRANPLINSGVAAIMLDITPAQLSALKHDVDNPIPVHSKEGRSVYYHIKVLHDWDANRRIRAYYRGTKTDEEDTGKVLNFTVEKSRLTKAQADEKELTVQQKRGELVPISLVADRYAIFCSRVRAGVLSIPAELGRSCPELSSSGMDVVRRVIAKVLNGLSDRYDSEDLDQESR